jgi:hypothetical protein
MQWVPGATSSSVKRKESEADHSLPTNAEDKKTWIYTSIPHVSHGLVLSLLSTETTLQFYQLMFSLNLMEMALSPITT